MRIEYRQGRNYLRVRGEYSRESLQSPLTRELPPRARRILYAPLPTSVCLGTTSACAENTPDQSTLFRTRRNYLRVRGEYTHTHIFSVRKPELPPRARRIPVQVSDGVQEFGTTSACAENTLSEILRIHSLRNYLRVRGEYMFRNFTQPSGVELPPRARRIRL